MILRSQNFGLDRTPTNPVAAPLRWMGDGEQHQFKSGTCLVCLHQISQAKWRSYRGGGLGGQHQLKMKLKVMLACHH